jgi:hypothetical protein
VGVGVALDSVIVIFSLKARVYRARELLAANYSHSPAVSTRLAQQC